MGDPMAPGGDYDLMVSYLYRARWDWHDVTQNPDFHSMAVNYKPWPLRQGLIRAAPEPDDYDPSRGYYSRKPVAYLPVKRTSGKDHLPALTITIQLTPPKLASNMKVPIWEGTPVDVSVVNLLREESAGVADTLFLKGTLGKDLTCRIEISAKDVAAWTRPDSQLQAVVNQNLLDFQFKLPGVLDQDGQPVVGQSHNRLFLYCKKTVVFLPGLFGSKIQFEGTGGETVGYPDFWENNPIPLLVPGLTSVPNPIFQRTDVLECDDQGVPLIPAPRPALLMLGGPFNIVGRINQSVIDPFNSLRNARLALLPHVPENFRLYTLNVYAYDWRGDLTDAAAGLIGHLDGIKRAVLAPAPDTDDQVAVMGHSTGGVIIRRALAPIGAGECTPGLAPTVKNASRPAADSLISFAFFLSVPFSGAPKAGAVLMTGREEPEGGRMIPLIIPESLVAVSLSMPIVYHLHTSAQYDYRPSTSPSRPPGSPTKDNEADKAALVHDAIVAGLMPRPWPVQAGLATDPDHRRRLALNSQKWHQLVADLHERTSGYSLQYAIKDSWDAVRWFESEIKARGLQEQYAVRPKPMEWSSYLADRAKRFHEASFHTVAGFPKARSCIFWGSCQKTPTLRQLNLSKVGTERFDDIKAFVEKRQILIADIGGKTARSDVSQFSNGGRKEFAQWSLDGKQFVETTWRLEWIKQLAAGDGTVPSDSQLAEGDYVASRLFTVNDGHEPPDHMRSTKSDRVWRTLLWSMHTNVVVSETGDEGKAADKKKALMPGPAKDDVLRLY